MNLVEWHESLQKPSKRHKFNAKKTKIGGEAFPSQLEASVWSLLKMAQKTGEIRGLKRYSTVHLTDAKISWKVDFEFYSAITGEKIWAEAKGAEQPDFRIKLKLWRVYGPGELQIWKGTAAKPILVETVIPKGTK